MGYFDGLKSNHVRVLLLVAVSDNEYQDQEYLGLYPAIETLSDLAGRLRLGFDGVGDDNHTVLLERAVSGTAVFMVPRSHRGWVVWR